MVVNPFLGLLVSLGFAALDHWLKKQIDAQGWDAPTRARAHILEADLIRILEPLIGDLARTFAPKLVARALAKAFPNDPSTGDWAG